MRRVLRTAGLALAIGLLAACSDGPTTPPPLVWARVTSPTTESLYDVWGSSATNVWAVGFNGTIVHYDGTRWSRALEGVTHIFRGIWGSGPADVWVVGFRSYADARAVIYHFNGQSWRQVTSVADIFSFAPLMDVWGTAATNVWAVGNGGVILRFDGSDWRNASVGPEFTNDAIWGSSSSDAWIVGPRTVLRYNGQGWPAHASPVLDSVQLTGGYGTGPTNHWASSVAGGLLHFDGLQWTRLATPSLVGVGRIRNFWGTGASRIWGATVGGTFGPGAVVHYDGTTWTIVARDDLNHHGIWGHSASDLWAVGENGVILHGTTAR
ncbi:MAG: hypothetical protein H7066_21160 [Cytophagaceae bacterium]|nr:hypothetical protein [Gemmatimonadaceae bacterium]